MSKFISEGLGDAFRNMPSLGQLKQDVYRYMKSKNSTLLDNIDDRYFNPNDVSEPENPRYFTVGTNKNIFQVPNNIIPNETKLWLRISLDETESGSAKGSMTFWIGATLSSFDGEIKPYHKTVQMLDFLHNWSNYNWSNLFSSAMNHIEKTVNSEASKDDKSKDEEDKTFEEFLEWSGILNIDVISKSLIEEFKSNGNNFNESQISKAIEKLYNSMGFTKFIDLYDVSENEGKKLNTSDKFKADILNMLD